MENLDDFLKNKIYFYSWSDKINEVNKDINKFPNFINELKIERLKDSGRVFSIEKKGGYIELRWDLIQWFLRYLKKL